MYSHIPTHLSVGLHTHILFLCFTLLVAPALLLSRCQPLSSLSPSLSLQYPSILRVHAVFNKPGNSMCILRGISTSLKGCSTWQETLRLQNGCYLTMKGFPACVCVGGKCLLRYNNMWAKSPFYQALKSALCSAWGRGVGTGLNLQPGDSARHSALKEGTGGDWGKERQMQSRWKWGYG